MREFKSLNPQGLPDDFDSEFHGEVPIVTIREANRRITISYTFCGFYLSDDSQKTEESNFPFQQVNIEATGYIGKSGKPNLPSFGRYVQIPFGCDYQFSVYKKESVEFDDILITPAQAELSDDPNQEYVFEYDKDFYASDQLFPTEQVKISGPFEIDGYTALLVHICPFQYNPAKKKLTGYANIEVTIDISEKGDGDEHPLPDPQNNMEAFGNMFLNPRRNIERRLEVDPNIRLFPPFLEPAGPELLIIYHNTFKKAAQKLAQWKNMRGLRCEIVMIDAVPNYSNASNDETRVAALKTYIRKAKKTKILNGRFLIPRLRYVLLFGDVDMIASETISDDQASGGAWGPVNISDYYYSTSKDPANPTDIVFPWLAIGRIPVRTSEEGVDVADQIIRYEKNPPCDPEYYRRLTFAALFQDKKNYLDTCDGRASRAYMRTMEYIRERMVSLGFDVQRVYVTDCPNTTMDFYSDGSAVPQDVKDAVVDSASATNMLISETSEGQLIIAHRDHGIKEGWHMPSFERQHLSDITSDVPSLFFSLNCQTGWFDRDTNKESFAETMLSMKGGAPSLIAATRNSSTSHNDEMMKALFDALWTGVLPTFPDSSTASYPVKNNRLGDILNYGKSYLPVVSSYDKYNKDHFEIYHIIGDPSLEVWKDEPVMIDLKAIYVKQGRNKGWLSIKLSSCPRGCVITIWHASRLIKRIEPSSTQISLPVKDLIFFHPGRPPQPVYVCFGAPGHRFRQAKISLA
ncbi:MAG: hypothetical protein GY751_15890 [Bacteroidetes bacterium]|nr:hypothetical protein [Bacteroidota bacterium]